MQEERQLKLEERKRVSIETRTNLKSSNLLCQRLFVSRYIKAKLYYKMDLHADRKTDWKILGRSSQKKT